MREQGGKDRHQFLDRACLGAGLYDAIVTDIGSQDRDLQHVGFRRDMYYLTKAVLAGLKIDNARIHEADFAAAHATMRKRHGDLLAALTAPGTGLQAIAATCAALLVELLSQRPVRFGEAAPETAGERALDISCLAPVVLACGLATTGRDGAPEPDMLEIAILAADIRHDRIAQACAKASPVEELTPVFATLLAHLP